MARLMKDRNNRYLIEVAQARKYVHCVIKDGCLVRCKKYHLTKLIKNDQHEGGACPYAEWWHPVPETEYPLAKAVEQFLSNPTGWTITEKARNVLTALKDQKPVSEDDMGDDEVVPLPASAVGEVVTSPVSTEDESKGESDMSKKAKSKKQKAPKAKTNGTKHHYAVDMKITVLAKENPKKSGSKAHKAFELYAKSKTVEDFLAKGGSRGDLSWDVKHKFIRVGA